MIQKSLLRLSCIALVVVLTACLMGTSEESTPSCRSRGGARMEDYSFTFPSGALLGAAASALLPDAGTFTGVLASIVTDFAIPDVRVTLASDIVGHVEIWKCKPCPSCDESMSLTVWGTVYLDGSGEWQNPSIPPPLPFSIAKNIVTREFLNESVADERVGESCAVKGAFRIPHSGFKVSLMFGENASIPILKTPSGTALPLQQDVPVDGVKGEAIDGIVVEYRGQALGEVSQDISVEVHSACSPTPFAGTKPAVWTPDLKVAVGETVRFVVAASTDLEATNLFFEVAPTEEWLLIEWTDDSESPGTISGSVTVRENAPVTIGQTATIGITVYDLLVHPREIHDTPQEGQYRNDGEGEIEITIVGNRAPVALPESVEMTSAESLELEGRIEAVVRAQDEDLPGNWGYEIRFFPLSLPSGLTCNTEALGFGGVGLTGTCSGQECWATFHCSRPCSSEVGLPAGVYTLPFRVLEQRPGESGEIEYGLFDDAVWTLTITSSAPVARPDDFTNIGSGMPVGVAIDTTETISGNVLANDADADGDSLFAELVEGSGPSNGVLSLDAEGNFTYTPNPGFVGVDTFEYRAFDGRDYSEPAVVTLTVHANPNQPPMMAVDELDGSELALLPEQDDRSCGVRVFVDDPNLDTEWYIETLTLDVSFSVSGLADASADLYWKEAGKDEWIPLRTSLVLTTPSVIDISLVPDAGVRSATLNLDLIDSQGERDARAIRWNDINSPPDVKVGDAWVRVGGYATQATCHMRGPAMLTMDPEWYDVGCLQFRDLDGDALIFRVSPKPEKGRADLLVASVGGQYSVTILYTIDREEALKDHRGEEPYVDRFSVVATDPSGEKAISNVEVTLEVLNSDPECLPDEVETFAGVPLLIDAVANDTDPDEDALTITAVGDPAHGATEIVGNEIRYTPDGGYCGEDAFTYDVADDYGGSATGPVTVIVLDTIPPVAVCQDATVFLDANGAATLDPAVLNNGSTDNCGIAGFTGSPDTFSCDEVGNRPVTLTVIDHAGNTATCQATVTVIDAIAPVAVGQDVTVALDASGRSSVDPAVVGATSTDNCVITSLTLSQTEFTCADLGANTVTLTVTDPSGNTDECAMTVTVIDTIPPVAAHQNLTVSLDADGVAVLNPAVVGAPSTDNCSIAGYALDRETFACADIGEHTVTLTVTDTSGLTDTCQATITVVDDLPPSIACPGSIFTAVTGSETGKAVTWTEPAITDNCGLLSTTATHTPGESFPIGSTTVQYTATDIHGNVGTCTFNVNVAEPLLLSCSDDSATTPDPSGTTVTFSPSVEGGCNPRVTCSPSSGSHFPVGTTQVSCTATDDCGGSDSCIFTVEILFVNEPPVAVDDEVDMPESGGCLTIPVLANDSDSDGHAVFVSWVGSPSCGTTAIVSEGGAIEYCTEGCSDPPETVTFDYRISDGYAESANATVSVDMPSGPIILFCPPPPPPDEEGKE